MDPFHEGGSLEGVDLAHCGSIIARAMKRANPDAVWVIQGWNENPRTELLQGVAKGDIVVLDLASEIKPNWGDPESPSSIQTPRRILATQLDVLHAFELWRQRGASRTYGLRYQRVL